MNSALPLPYRRGVGIALLNSERRVFIGERIDTPGAWQMPQGGIDDDESIEQAAFRELAEEIGTNKAEILRISERTVKYDLPADMRQRLWQGRYAGQEQTWVAMRFLGADDEINLNAHTPPEFARWQWARLQDTIGLIVPFKRDIYTQIIAMFEDLA